MTFKEHLREAIWHYGAVSDPDISDRQREYIISNLCVDFQQYGKVVYYEGLRIERLTWARFDTPVHEIVRGLSYLNYNREVHDNLTALLGDLHHRGELLCGFPVETDPMRYCVVFAREVNPNRVEMPPYAHRVEWGECAAVFVSRQRHHTPALYDEFGNLLNASVIKGMSKQMHDELQNQIINFYRLRKLNHLR